MRHARPPARRSRFDLSPSRSPAGPPTSPGWSGRCARRATTCPAPPRDRLRRAGRGRAVLVSAAIECAVLTALRRPRPGWTCPLAQRAALAQRAENDYVGMPCGIMDQSASTLCRAGHALFLDCRTLARPSTSRSTWPPQGLAILVIDTRAPHRHVDGEYAARRAACEQAAASSACPRCATRPSTILSGSTTSCWYRRARHVITENAAGAGDRRAAARRQGFARSGR